MAKQNKIICTGQLESQDQSIEEMWKKHLDLVHDLRSQLEDGIKKMVRTIAPQMKRIDLSDILDEYGLDAICVSYDGGNHPEYASCLCSGVEGIFLSNKKIYLITEDSEKYDTDRISSGELYDVYNLISELCHCKFKRSAMVCQMISKVRESKSDINMAGADIRVTKTDPETGDSKDLLVKRVGWTGTGAFGVLADNEEIIMGDLCFTDVENIYSFIFKK